MSDRLFSCFQDDSRLSCPTFIECASFLCRASPPERIQLLFAMISFDGEVSRMQLQNSYQVSVDDCSIKEIGIIQASISRMVSEFYGQEPIKLSQDQFTERYKSGKVHALDKLWNFLVKQFDIREQIINFIENRSDCLSEMKSDRINSLLVEFGIQSRKPIHQGTMHRLLQGKGLKAYHYKLINRVLYMYRSQEDLSPKKAFFIGFGTCLQRITPKIQTMDDNKIYGIDLMSGYKRRQYYFLEKESMEEWIKALEDSTGVKSDVVKDYWFERELARSKRGAVWKSTHRASGRDYAIKVVEKEKLKTRQLRKVREQIEAMQMARHPCLIGLVQVYQDFQKLYLVEEYMNGNSLSTFLQVKSSVHQSISFKEACLLIKQVAIGLKFLHRLNITHGNVTVDNILLQCKESKEYDIIVFDILDVKLSDYSCCSLSDEWSHKSDIYSLGVVFHLLLTDQLPLQEQEKIKSPENSKLLPNVTPLYRKKVPRQIIKVIREMLSQTEEFRPSPDLLIETLEETLK